jgi:5-methylcytosine-specific restriction enzyme subunit McrC
MLVASQLKNHISSRPKFYCAYDDLTFDNLENQIVLKATTLLIPLIRFNEEIKKELHRYSHYLRDAVNLVNIVPEDCSRVQYSRLNDYYETIIQFSKVILQDYFIRSTHKGAARGFNFIVNMNKVYEDFVTELVNQVVSEEKEFQDYVALPQTKFRSLVREGTINIKPDIILKHKDKQEYPLIIDAKYKKQDANADYYQVIAYALGIPKVKACCLLYPLHLDPESQTHTLDVKPFGSDVPEIKLHALKVDLFGNDRLSFGDYIRTIKTTLKNDMVRCLVLGNEP